MNVNQGAKNLVERSRAGDQNATATIVKVRQNAAKGNTQAKKALKALHGYVKENPVNMGAEGSGAMVPWSVAGVSLDKKKVGFTLGGGVLGYLVYGFPGAAVLATAGYFASKLKMVSA